MTLEIHSIEDFSRLRGEWIALSEAGRFEEALERVSAARGWAEASGDAELELRTFLNHAAIAVELGRSDEFVAPLRERLMRSAGEESQFLAAYTIARGYELKKDFKKAAFYARIARDRAHFLEPGRQASSENLLANLLVAESRFAEATETYETALARLTGADAAFRAAVIRYNLGYCRIVLGDRQGGFAALYLGLRALARLGNERHQMLARLDLSFAHLEKGKARYARRHAERALGLARLLGARESERNALYLLGAAALAAGDRFAARRAFGELQAGFYPDADYLPELLLEVDVRKLVNLKA